MRSTRRQDDFFKRVVAILVLCTLSNNVYADKYDDFWIWLTSVEQRLLNPPNHNEFRFSGYKNAVPRHLKNISPLIFGYTEVYREPPYTLSLFSMGEPEAVQAIEELAKRAPKSKRWVVVTRINPGEHNDFSIWQSNEQQYSSNDVLLMVSDNNGKKDIIAYLPGLETIDSPEERKSYFESVKGYIIYLTGESLFGKEVGQISYQPLVADIEGSILLSELLEHLNQ